MTVPRTVPRIHTILIPGPRRGFRQARGAAALGAGVGAQADGCVQKARDLQGDALVLDAITSAHLRWCVGDKRADPAGLQTRATLALTVDPLYAAAQIDTRAPTLAILAICPAEDRAEAVCLRPARDLRTGGNVVHDPLISLGAGDAPSLGRTVAAANRCRRPRPVAGLIEAAGRRLSRPARGRGPNSLRHRGLFSA